VVRGQPGRNLTQGTPYEIIDDKPRYGGWLQNRQFGASWGIKRVPRAHMTTRPEAALLDRVRKALDAETTLDVLRFGVNMTATLLAAEETGTWEGRSPEG
jgi:hypothetical protein